MYSSLSASQGGGLHGGLQRESLMDSRFFILTLLTMYLDIFMQVLQNIGFFCLSALSFDKRSVKHFSATNCEHLVLVSGIAAADFAAPLRVRNLKLTQLSCAHTCCSCSRY